MKYIHDDSTPVVTGSAIADAVIEDAAALGANGLSDPVTSRPSTSTAPR